MSGEGKRLSLEGQGRDLTGVCGRGTSLVQILLANLKFTTLINKNIINYSHHAYPISLINFINQFIL